MHFRSILASLVSAILHPHIRCSRLLRICAPSHLRHQDLRLVSLERQLAKSSPSSAASALVETGDVKRTLARLLVQSRPRQVRSKNLVFKSIGYCFSSEPAKRLEFDLIIVVGFP
ncbi:hypothetical protein P389DRAFT_29966 [Cystobasidium minutum MCA 4210]|uniref:uncharacterized protein n=1 Tax=Cystobasidium minutum MCA 4210 TaxID=1397322 RepID=UPI0034CE59D0|eukprot:jgi/Rhomi1/29966/CE29965_29